MAAEDDGAQDDKPAGAGRKSRTRRQRPPVTIDLTAERVAADKAEAPATGGGRSRREAGRPETAEAPPRREATPPAAEPAEPSRAGARARAGEPEPARTTLAARRQHHRQRRRLDARGACRRGGRHRRADPAHRPAGDRPGARRRGARRRVQAADQAKTASEAVAALDRRVSAVEMITQNLPGKSRRRDPQRPGRPVAEGGRARWRRRATSPRSKTSWRRSPRRSTRCRRARTQDELAALADARGAARSRRNRGQRRQRQPARSGGGALPPHRQVQTAPQCARRPDGRARKEALGRTEPTARSPPAPSPWLR